MFDWIESIGESIDSLAEGLIMDLEYIYESLDQLLTNLNNYIEFSTYYIWLSGILLGIIFCMLCVVLSNQKKIKTQNEKIMHHLGIQEEKPKQLEGDNLTNIY